jgi:hypothetical protein
MSRQTSITKTAPELPSARVPTRPKLLQRKCACGGTPGPTGECAECRKRRLGLQRRSVGQAATSSAPPVVGEVLRSPGKSLEPETRAFMESRFGHDFSRVRVHADARAAQSARDINARAYTVGDHIAFGARQYAPQTEAGKHLLAHELTHVIQQQPGENSRLAVVDSVEHEREADTAADSIRSHRPVPTLRPLYPRSVSRQKLEPDEPPHIERSFELDPQLFLTPMDAPAPKEGEKCEEFPGGSTDCEVDERTGTPTGKVMQRIDETNPCTRPCVQQHEAVHVRQLKTLCPELRDCYLAADKGKRPASECAKMVIFGMKERECEAYKVSVPCVEQRLKSAKECQSKVNKEYGTRKLASEKCFRDKNCGGPGGK